MRPTFDFLNKPNIGLILIFIFHLVGLVGLSLAAYQHLFLQLTPLNLIITFGIFYYVNGNFTGDFFFLAAGCSIFGFMVEVVGVQSGILFGDYQYGTVLGFSLYGVPLLIGLNWFLLCIISAGFANYITKNIFLQPLLGAALTLILDIPLEPVAMNLGYWSWFEGTIPMQNFVMWFLTALVIHNLIALVVDKFSHKLSIGIYVIYLAFFTLLNVTLKLWVY